MEIHRTRHTRLSTPTPVREGLSFGDLLRRHRLAVGLTQRELAERAGLSLRAINALESGDRQAPRKRTIAVLASALTLAPTDRATLEAAVRHPRLMTSAVSEPTLMLLPPPTLHNLPLPPGPLIGREREITEVTALLRGNVARLVTLTGPGGVGKTRLALAVARALLDAAGAFVGGVWFVPLAPLRDATLVIPRIARTLGLSETGSEPIEDTLRAFLRERTLLLVLDNFEHVSRATLQVSGLLDHCAGLALLVTSRSPLLLRTEQHFPVSPLAVPSATPTKPLTGERLAQYPAVELFVERVRAAQPDFHVTEVNAVAIAAIANQLDGLPLAIELAAARARVLSPAALLARLTSQLTLLTGGARDMEERQRTMRATLTWSEDLLPANERTLLRRLAVFSGGCTLEAVEAVCAAPEQVEPLHRDALDGLSTLLDQALIQRREEDGESRFEMLHVIREYALERLEASGEAESLRRAHAAYFLALAERIEPELSGPSRRIWHERLGREHDNLRAALGWARERGETELGLRVAIAVVRFWITYSFLREGRTWIESLMALASKEAADGTLAAVVWARALYAAGTLAMFARDYITARTQLEQALPLARAADDLETAEGALSNLGQIAQDEGNLERAKECFEEALELDREIGYPGGIAGALTNLGSVAHDQGDLERTTTATQEALGLFRQMGNLLGAAICLANLGQVAQQQGEMTQAEALGREALALFREIGAPRRCTEGLEVLAGIAGAAGQGVRAARLMGAAMVLREALEVPQPAHERADMEQAVTAARAALGEDAWAAAFAQGRALSLDEAMDEALAASEPPGDAAPDEAPAQVDDAASASPPSASHRGAAGPTAKLTAREHEVLRLLADGLSDAEISTHLVISVRTVNHHTAAIYGKLGVSSRATATRFALEHGLL